MPDEYNFTESGSKELKKNLVFGFNKILLRKNYIYTILGRSYKHLAAGFSFHGAAP